MLPKKEVVRKPDTGAGTLGFTKDSEILGVYAPGSVAYILKPGQARLVPKGSEIIFQMHYTANGKAGSDRSRVGFIFAKEPPKERVAKPKPAAGNSQL